MPTWLSLRERCRRRQLRLGSPAESAAVEGGCEGFGSYGLPSPSSLRSATSPTGRGKKGLHAWLSLRESCRRRRLRGLWQLRFTLSDFASLSHLSQGERQGRTQKQAQQNICCACSLSHAILFGLHKLILSPQTLSPTRAG